MRRSIDLSWAGESGGFTKVEGGGGDERFLLVAVSLRGLGTYACGADEAMISSA